MANETIMTLTQTLEGYFDQEKVEQTARETKFVQRESKMSGSIFLQALIFSCIQYSVVSLKKMAYSCADLGVEIAPQSIDDRITEYSVDFMSAMFKIAMSQFQNKQPLPLSVLQQFNGVHLFDSTIISLPAVLAEEYPGSGGCASTASLKIQLGYEFLSGNFSQMSLHPGKENDQSFEGHLSVLSANDMAIMDLGYFKLNNLQEIDQRGAFFTIPYFYPTKLLNLDETPFELLSFLKNAPKQAFEKEILLGANHKLPCRLIAIPLGQEAANRQRQKAKESARRQGRTLSPQYLVIFDWVILLTNAPQAMLSLEQVALLYRLRWQIELVFKLWKSFCGLREIATFRRDRILTELYARLIGAVLTQFLLAPLRMPFGCLDNREISPVQVRYCLTHLAQLINISIGDVDQLQKVLSQLHRLILRLGFKEKRNKKPNICHRLALLFAALQIDQDDDPDFQLTVETDKPVGVMG